MGQSVYNGWIEVELEDGTTKKIGIERPLPREDAGKTPTVQMATLTLTSTAKGVPLIQVVSEADMRSPESLRLSNSPQRKSSVLWHF